MSLSGRIRDDAEPIREQPTAPAKSGGRAGFSQRGAVRVLSTLVRIAASWIWTVLVGTPLVVVIYLRYWYGLVSSLFGRLNVLDHVLETNAHLAGWVAQRLWSSVLLPLLNVPVRVRESLPIDWSKTHVICSNHASLLDILALIRVVPPPFRFVAKRELTRWPIVGWALRPAGQIIVDRRDHDSAIQSIAEAAGRKIRGQVIFFVEGTRSRTGQLQSFKKGAFHYAIRNQLPVLPVAVRGSYDALAKLPWWRLHGGTEIEIDFCPLIPPVAISAGEIGPHVEALRADTRAAIAAALEA
jgi:1-acyl-sn-glycerol-3-phosphate acyltransferase